ncbi:MAG: SRPBCC family protein [Mycobacteriales bacterium]
MATIVREFRLDRPVDVVWKDFADVGRINKLIDYLGEVTLDGNVRSCSIGDSGELEELIVSVDQERKRIAYAITRSPFNFQFHSASMQIVPDGDVACCVWTTDVLPDSLVGAVTEPIDAAVDSIKSHFA